MPTFTGMCRIKSTDGQPDMLRVTDGDMIFVDVDELSYRRSCFQPLLEDLVFE